MAREVLAKIKEAEEKNQALMLKAQQESESLQLAAEKRVQELKQAQQETVKEQVTHRKNELEAQLKVQQDSLFSNQKEADTHYQDLFEKNKQQALNLVLKKVRENYGS